MTDVGKGIYWQIQERGEDFSSIKNLKGFPEQVNEHNSLSDAKWNKELHEFLKIL